MRREHVIWSIGAVVLALCFALRAPDHAHAAGVPREVFEQLQRIRQAVHGCYERELSRNPAFTVSSDAAGVRVRVLRTGALRLELVGSTGVLRVDRCLRRSLRNLRLQRDGRAAHEQYPFLFNADGEPRVLHVR